ncbi:MAG TPA: glycosyltransferase, partial [Nitrosospira sp.]
MLADTINSKKSGESPNLANREPVNREAANRQAISGHADAGLDVRDTRTEEKELAVMIPTSPPLLRVVIILPTYNERENIGNLIDALQAQFKTLPHDMQILVVDDSSPDGTADVVRMKQASSFNVHLLMGQKSGLGAAYIRGMIYAMDQLGADAVFEMDADFSHKPEDVPRLLAALDAGADFVIGSRYVKGGSIPEKWGFLRRMNSWGGNIVARYVAGIYKVR